MSEVIASASQPASAFYSEQTIASGDGTPLFIRRWLPADIPTRAHVLILHGYLDHSGRYSELAHHLCMAGIACVAPDLRGHGRSGGQRAYVRKFDDYHADVDAALSLIETHPPFILGHSHGALIALDFAGRKRAPMQGLVITNPFLAQTNPVQGLKLRVAQWAARYAPRLSLPSGLKPTEFTHDPLMVEAHRRDPLVHHNANASWLAECEQAQARVRGMKSLHVPFLYVYSDSDPVASPTANQQLATQLEGADKTVSMRPGELHEVLNELKREQLHQQLARWILDHSLNS